MTNRATLIASLTAPDDLARIVELAGVADMLEVRADLLGEVPIERLRDGFPGPLLFTLRSEVEGGRGEVDPALRRRRLTEAAAAGYDLLDLEAARDLDAALLHLVPPPRRVLSWHGAGEELAGLRSRCQALFLTPAHWYKLVPGAAEPGDELAVLSLLRELERRDLIAFASGGAASWSRLVAPRLGAPVLFAAAGDTPAAPGQLSFDVLRRDYGLPSLPAVEGIFGVVGGVELQSLSPRLHNAAYRELGLPYLYVPFPVAAFGPFWLEMVEARRFEVLGMPLAGLSVTAPHKAAAAAVAGALSPVADFLDSVNTLVRTEDVWEGESTDGDGVLWALRESGVELQGIEAAVLGAGGAGRAAAWALARSGARVALIHRDRQRGEKVARRVGVRAVELAAFQPDRFAVVVHATPQGTADDDPLPVEPRRLAAGAVVVDLVYRREGPTPWVSAVRAAGRRAIDGREVLLGQAIPQFRLMTGRELPVPAARRWLGLEGAP